MGRVVVKDPEAEYAYAAQQRIVIRAQEIRDQLVEFIRDVYEFKDKHLFRKLGKTSFNEWLADPEVDLPVERRMLFVYLQVWRDLVVERGMDPELLKTAPITKVAEVSPAIRRGADADRALADAHALTRQDLHHRYRNTDPVEGPDNSSKYDGQAEPEYVSCPACGSRVTRDRVKSS